MNTTAYDNFLPCLNPNCKSHGKPHPNCRCYGSGMSEGGEVGFCSKNRRHEKGCEYYLADGGAVPSFDEMKDESQSQPMDFDSMPSEGMHFDSMPDEGQKYEGLGETLKAGAEGLAQGVAGPIAPWLEKKVLGVDPEDIKNRAAAHPIASGVGEAAGFLGSLATGVGEAGLIAKGAGALSELSGLGTIGQAVLRGAIEAASFEKSDEMTKALLATPGSDPEVPTSAALIHVGAAGLMGAVTGGVFGLGEKLIGKGMAAAKSPQVVNATENILCKIAEDPSLLSRVGINTENMATTAALGVSAKTGSGTMGYLGIKSLIKKQIEKIFGGPISKANEYISDAFLRAAMKTPEGVPNAIHYALQATKGAQKAGAGVNTILNKGYGRIAEPASDQAKSFLKGFVENGQVDQQIQNSMQEQNQSGFASGGEVSINKSGENNHFATVFPEQNTILNSAKGRISNYLNSVRPIPNQPKLPFDATPDNKEKDRSYDRAIELAANPLSILNHVNNGRLTTEDMTHFTSLYPEVHRYLSKELTKRITKAQLDNEPMDYRKRQAASLFLGADLDSTFTPQAMQMVQMSFQGGSNAQQPAPQPKKKTSSMSKGPNSYLTDSQGRIQRQQNSKA